PPAYPPPPVP
nr:Chain B, 3BP-2